MDVFGDLVTLGGDVAGAIGNLFKPPDKSSQSWLLPAAILVGGYLLLRKR